MADMQQRIRAETILGLLAKRHGKDVFVCECKNGPTWFGPHSRLDAWAMKRSWAHPCTWGYEVKSSRGDFLKDDKWRAYMEYCNQFYFACPTGMIEVEELPQDVGLLWASKTGGRLYTKRKAAHREANIPEDFWRYIVMSRIQARDSKSEHDRAYWTKWLEDRKLDREFGYRVGRGIRKRLEEEVRRVQEQQRNIEARMAGFGPLQELLAALGVDMTLVTAGGYSAYGRQRAAAAIRRTLAGLPPNLGRALNQAGAACNRAAEVLKRAEDQANESSPTE